MPSTPAVLAVTALAMIAVVAAATGPDGRGLTSGPAAVRAGPRPAPAGPSNRSRVGPPPEPVRNPTVIVGGNGNSSESGSGTTFAWPLTGTPHVLRRFAPGPHPWSAGHRGADLGGSAAEPVRASGAGMVSFSGMIAGRGVVAIRHPNGVRTTYEPLSPTVTSGQVVVRGQRIGTLAAGPGHCSGGPCLHWGALAGERYLDPLGLLAGSRRPPVLLPVDPPG